MSSITKTFYLGHQPWNNNTRVTFTLYPYETANLLPVYINNIWVDFWMFYGWVDGKAVPLLTSSLEINIWRKTDISGRDPTFELLSVNFINFYDTDLRVKGITLNQNQSIVMDVRPMYSYYFTVESNKTICQNVLDTTCRYSFSWYVQYSPLASQGASTLMSLFDDRKSIPDFASF